MGESGICVFFVMAGVHAMVYFVHVSDLKT